MCWQGAISLARMFNLASLSSCGCLRRPTPYWSVVQRAQMYATAGCMQSSIPRYLSGCILISLLISAGGMKRGKAHHMLACWPWALTIDGGVVNRHRREPLGALELGGELAPSSDDPLRIWSLPPVAALDLPHSLTVGTSVVCIKIGPRGEWHSACGRPRKARLSSEIICDAASSKNSSTSAQ